MSTATGPLSCWCADRRRTGNGRKILLYIQSKSRFGGPKRLFLAGYGANRRAGKSTKRRQWRMQQGDFEEVPRLADTTVAVSQLARRWVREPRPYGGYKSCGTAGRCGHRPLRNRIMGCVGEGLWPSHGRGRTPPVRKRYKKCGGPGRPGGRPLRYYPRLFTSPSLFFPLTTAKNPV